MTIAERAAELRREYHRQWRKKNADKVRAAQDRYWIRRATEEIQHQQTDEQATEE